MSGTPKEKGKAIGGYFELELPRNNSFPYPQAYKFQSARSAFYALLEVVRPRKVWMPRYICNTMLAPLEALDIAYEFYSINKNFECDFHQPLNSDELLLYVNYFGVCQRQKMELLDRYPAEQLIFDHSQAFFDTEQQGLATLYSPRKFFGVPDGGLLVTHVVMHSSSEQQSSSLSRTEHLLLRIERGAEAGYEKYRDSEVSLREDLQPLRMSNLTERILHSIDFISVVERRNENFNYLHEQLADINELDISDLAINAPLSYPLLLRSDGLRNELIKEKIFVPKYWPDAQERCEGYIDESYLLNYLFPLPCDQRYSLEDMKRIVGIIQQFNVEKT